MGVGEIGDIGPEHDERAVQDVDDVEDAPDQREADGDACVEPAQDQSIRSNLQIDHDRAEPSEPCTAGENRAAGALRGLDQGAENLNSPCLMAGGQSTTGLPP